MGCSRRDFFRHGLAEAFTEAARLSTPLPRPRDPWEGWTRLGPLRLREDRCFSALGSPCDVCVERCPEHPTPIRVARGGPPQLEAALCTGCGICAHLCPADALATAL